MAGRNKAEIQAETARAKITAETERERIAADVKKAELHVGLAGKRIDAEDEKDKRRVSNAPVVASGRGWQIFLVLGLPVVVILGIVGFLFFASINSGGKTGTDIQQRIESIEKIKKERAEIDSDLETARIQAEIDKAKIQAEIDKANIAAGTKKP